MVIPSIDAHSLTALGFASRLAPVILYIGPDQIMPLTSVLGGIIGVALMFWNRLVFAARRSVAFLTRGRRTDNSQSAN